MWGRSGMAVSRAREGAGGPSPWAGPSTPWWGDSKGWPPGLAGTAGAQQRCLKPALSQELTSFTA